MRALTIAACFLVIFTCGGAYAVVANLAADDCPSISNQSQLWHRLQERWNDGKVVAVFRHAQDCDPDLPGCTNGNEHLTDFGREQARTIHEGFHSLLSDDYRVSHSHLDRTTETASIAFNSKQANPNLAKPCKHTFEDYLRSQRIDGNQIFVTHSSCLNSLKTGTGDRLLGFNASKDEHFGIGAFFSISPKHEIEVLGCVWPGEWDHLQQPPVHERGLIEQKLAVLFP